MVDLRDALIQETHVSKARCSGKALAAFSFLIGLGCAGLWCSVPSSPAGEAPVSMAALPTMQRSTLPRVSLQPFASFKGSTAAGPMRGHVDLITCSATSQVTGNAIKEEQLKKMTNDDGFISALDESGGTSPKTLAAYGITDKDYKDQDEMMSKVHDLRAKIMTNPTYKEGKIIGAILFEDTINRDVEGMPTAEYLWSKKKVVPFLKSDIGLAPAADGVQMMKEHPGLEEMLDRGLAKGIWGTKQRSQIQSANPEGIKKLVAQQFEFGKRTIAKGMIPILEPEVDITASDKAKIEEMLLPELMAGLDTLKPEDKVIFKLSLPEKPNLYAPLMGYPQVVRVVALSGGYDLAESNKRLAQNAGMIASFSRTLREGLHVSQSDEEFTKTLGATLDAVNAASKAPAYSSQVSGNTVKEEQLKKMTKDAGFISALDESGGTSPKTLAAYGITDKDYKDDDEMMSKVHDLRAKIMTNPMYKEGKIIGAILFEDTINRDVEGMPTCQYLWEKKKVVPFLKSDIGLAPAADGVQMMKEHPGLEEMLDRGLAKGIWGTKQRSQIQSANPEGIKKLVAQQFEFGKRTIAKGMIPILEPEVDITAADKGKIEELLLPELMAGLDKLSPDQKVIFKLSL